MTCQKCANPMHLERVSDYFVPLRQWHCLICGRRDDARMMDNRARQEQGASKPFGRFLSAETQTKWLAAQARRRKFPIPEATSV